MSLGGWIAGRLEKFGLTTKLVMQMIVAERKVKAANESEVTSAIKLHDFDTEVERLDEVMNRLRDQGALID